MQERRDAWRIARKRIGYYEQQAELTALRKLDGESASFRVAIQRDPLRRVQRAFEGFFRRAKRKQEAESGDFECNGDFAPITMTCVDLIGYN